MRFAHCAVTMKLKNHFTLRYISISAYVVFGRSWFKHCLRLTIFIKVWWEFHTGHWPKSLDGRNHLENVDFNVRIILNRISKKFLTCPIPLGSHRDVGWLVQKDTESYYVTYFEIPSRYSPKGTGKKDLGQDTCRGPYANLTSPWLASRVLQRQWTCSSSLIEAVCCNVINLRESTVKNGQFI